MAGTEVIDLSLEKEEDCALLETSERKRPNNDVGLDAVKFELPINEYQQNAFCMKVKKRYSPFTSSLFHLKSRWKVKGLFDEVFGIDAMRGDHPHNIHNKGIDVKESWISELKKLVKYDELKELAKWDESKKQQKEVAFLCIGNKRSGLDEKEEAVQNKIVFQKLLMSSVTRLLEENDEEDGRRRSVLKDKFEDEKKKKKKSSKKKGGKEEGVKEEDDPGIEIGRIDESLIELYFDCLNLSLGNCPSEMRISDILILKPWSLYQVMDQRSEYLSLGSSKVTFDAESQDCKNQDSYFREWVYTSTCSDSNNLKYWLLSNSPLRKILGVWFDDRDDHFVSMSFKMTMPSTVTFQDTKKKKGSFSAEKHIAHYLSGVKQMQHGVVPKLKTVKHGERTYSYYPNTESANGVDVYVEELKEEDYAKRKIPTQRANDQSNSGVLAMHYVTCESCDCKCNPKFDCSKFRRQMFLFLVCLKLFLEDEAEAEKGVSILDFLKKRHRYLKTHLPAKAQATLWPFYNRFSYNTTILPYSAFKNFLHGHTYPSGRVSGMCSVSVISAMHMEFTLILYVGSHLNPCGCVFGKKVAVVIPPGHCVVFHQNLIHSGARGVAGKKKFRLFAYGTHEQASKDGPAAMQGRTDETYYTFCPNVGCLCRSSHRDAWVVHIPSLGREETVGDIRLHGFCILKLNCFEDKHTVDNLEKYIGQDVPIYPKSNPGESIQQGPTDFKKRFPQAYPDDKNERYQYSLTTKDRGRDVVSRWEEIFGDIEKEVNSRCWEQMFGSITLSHHKVLYNDSNNPPAEQYQHTDFVIPTTNCFQFSNAHDRFKLPPEIFVKYEDYFPRILDAIDKIDKGVAQKGVAEFIEYANDWRQKSSSVTDSEFFHQHRAVFRMFSQAVWKIRCHEKSTERLGKKHSKAVKRLLQPHSQSRNEKSKKRKLLTADDPGKTPVTSNRGCEVISGASLEILAETATKMQCEESKTIENEEGGGGGESDNESGGGGMSCCELAGSGDVKVGSAAASSSGTEVDCDVGMAEEGKGAVDEKAKDGFAPASEGVSVSLDSGAEKKEAGGGSTEEGKVAEEEEPKDGSAPAREGASVVNDAAGGEEEKADPAAGSKSNGSEDECVGGGGSLSVPIESEDAKAGSAAESNDAAGGEGEKADPAAGSKSNGSENESVGGGGSLSVPIESEDGKAGSAAESNSEVAEDGSPLASQDFSAVSIDDGGDDNSSDVAVDSQQKDQKEAESSAEDSKSANPSIDDAVGEEDSSEPAVSTNSKLLEWSKSALKQKNESKKKGFYQGEMNSLVDDSFENKRLIDLARHVHKNGMSYYLHYQWDMNSYCKTLIKEFFTGVFDDDADKEEVKHFCDIENVQVLYLCLGERHVGGGRCRGRKAKKKKSGPFEVAMCLFWPIPKGNDDESIVGAEIIYIAVTRKLATAFVTEPSFAKYTGRGIGTFLLQATQHLVHGMSGFESSNLYLVTTNFDDSDNCNNYYKKLGFVCVEEGEYLSFSSAFAKHMRNHNYDLGKEQYVCMKKIGFITAVITELRDNRCGLERYEVFEYPEDDVIPFLLMSLNESSFVKDLLKKLPAKQGTLRIPLGELIAMFFPKMKSGPGDIEVPKLELELLRHLYVEVVENGKFGTLWSPQSILSDDELNYVDGCVKKYCGSGSVDRFDWLKLLESFKERFPASPLLGRRGSAEQLSAWYFPSKDASVRSLQCKLCCKQCGEVVCKVGGLHSRKLWMETTNTLINEFMEGHFFSACQRGAVCSGLREIHCVFRDAMDRDSLRIASGEASVESIQRGIDSLMKVVSACFKRLLHVGMLWVDAAGLSFKKLDAKTLVDPDFHGIRGDKSRLRGILTRSKEMYEDVLFQRSISHMMCCDGSEKRSVCKRVSNPLDLLGVKEYYIAKGKKTCVDNDETKTLEEDECRIIDPRWISEIIETSEHEDMRVLTEKMKENKNRLFSLNKRLRENIKANADLILERQVKHIVIKKNGETGAREFYGKVSKNSAVEELLTHDWLRNNFAFRNPDFYRVLFREKKVGETVDVPVGSSRRGCSLVLDPEAPSNSPSIRYRQLFQDTCVMSSAASALHFYGKTEYAALIDDKKLDSLQSGNPLNYFVDFVRKSKPRLFDPKKIKAQDLKQIDRDFKQIDPEFVHVAMLGSSGHDCLHVVSIYKGYIFDSTHDVAISLDRDNLNWCVSGNSADKSSYFVRFLKLYKLVPIQSNKN